MGVSDSHLSDDGRSGFVQELVSQRGNGTALGIINSPFRRAKMHFSERQKQVPFRHAGSYHPEGRTTNSAEIIIPWSDMTYSEFQHLKRLRSHCAKIHLVGGRD